MIKCVSLLIKMNGQFLSTVLSFFIFEIGLIALHVSAHVGKPCQNLVLMKFCSGSNVFCDSHNICRCKAAYPVLLEPHACSKPKKFAQRCQASAECKYSDPNTYCNQLPYKSSCECLDDFNYSEATDKCLRRSRGNKAEHSNLVLPTAVGISLALACVLCCFLAVLHFCRRRERRHSNARSSSSWPSFLVTRSRENTISNANRIPNGHHACQSTLLGAIDPLPPYDVAISLQELELAVNEFQYQLLHLFKPVDQNNILDVDANETVDEPPPCYEDVMKETAELEENKTKSCQ